MPTADQGAINRLMAGGKRRGPAGADRPQGPNLCAQQPDLRMPAEETELLFQAFGTGHVVGIHARQELRLTEAQSPI